MFKLTFFMALMVLGMFISADKVTADDDCNACGEECKKFCGTKQFKLCCHNYMRKKRSAVDDMEFMAKEIADVGEKYYSDDVRRFH